MYPLVSSASILARIYICYVTIETLPIFANPGIDWLVGQIASIYTIFRLICYPTTGYIIDVLGIDDSSARAVIYFLVYLPIVALYWAILALLTHVFGVLPVYLN